jgi:peptidoglycan/xylan/chitin deacetylase (PgdA/CDA1 family)
VIDLIADDDRTGFGIRTMLEVERIPYRRLERAEDFDARVLVVARADVSPAMVALAERVPTVVIGAPGVLVPALFGVGGRCVKESSSVLGLEDPIWPASVRTQAARFEKFVLRVPRASIYAPEGPCGQVLASRRDGDGRPGAAIVRHGSAWWCLVDFGQALTNLLEERYRGEVESGVAPRLIPRGVLWLYYHAPEALRRVVQRRAYERLHGRVAIGERSDYPVDASGWLLIELMKAVLRQAAVGLVRVARWPAPFRAAAALTHDLEPSRYSYTRGVTRLLRRIGRRDYPATFGVVARRAARHWRAPAVAALGPHDVICHGLEHRGETAVGHAGEIGACLATAKIELERTLGRTVEGFRSPRLDRSPALLEALDRSGFRYDSSYPDSDRENVRGFGAGVRVNVPFRPPIARDGERVRASACLELPVSSPDCIQPLFEGGSVGALAAAVREKIGFVTATAGLYVGIIHAGVFGARDTARRGAHLGYVLRRLREPHVWLTSTGRIAEWWCAREALDVRSEGGAVRVTNRGPRGLAGVRLVVEAGDGPEVVHDLPAMDPGATVLVDLNVQSKAAAAATKRAPA